MRQEPQKKPFAFRPSIETLKYFKDASPEAKLNWLEEANRFVSDFLHHFEFMSARFAVVFINRHVNSNLSSSGPLLVRPAEKLILRT